MCSFSFSATKSMAAMLSSFSVIGKTATVRPIGSCLEVANYRAVSSPICSYVPPRKFKRFMCHASSKSDEEVAAKAAAATADAGGPTIFDKIIAKEIPSTIVYEDDRVLAFRDINPQAPVHVLVIPKFRDGLTQLGAAETRHTDILGHLLFAAKVVAEKEGISDGFRVVINNGPSACQSVYHLHLHVLGGRQMKWPPG